uniref:Uncharacterized protein n=1 Tax=Ignisphaera aggregans TaxID=334771 RepID=A0A7C5TH21_9CREN
MRRRFLLALVSICIAFLTASILYLAIPTPSIVIRLVSIIMDSFVILSILVILSFIGVLICIVLMLTTDNEYILAVAALATTILVVFIVTLLPRLMYFIDRYLQEFFSDLTKRLVGS